MNPAYVLDPVRHVAHRLRGFTKSASLASNPGVWKWTPWAQIMSAAENPNGFYMSSVDTRDWYWYQYAIGPVGLEQIIVTWATTQGAIGSRHSDPVYIPPGRVAVRGANNKSGSAATIWAQAVL